MKLSRSLRCVESSSSKVKTVKTQMHAVLKCCVCFVVFFFLVLENTELPEIHDFHNDFTITLRVGT